MIIGLRIKELSAKKFKTVQEFANAIGRSHRETYNIFKKEYIKSEVLKKICEVLNVSEDELKGNIAIVQQPEQFEAGMTINGKVIITQEEYNHFQKAIMRENELLREIAELRKEKIKELESDKIEGGNPVNNPATASH